MDKKINLYILLSYLQCTVASKFILLKESVRDTADLYFSLKYPPPLFINDTACTFVRHCDIRFPEITRTIWGEYEGCFDKPQIGVHPTKVDN